MPDNIYADKKYFDFSDYKTRKGFNFFRPMCKLSFSTRAKLIVEGRENIERDDGFIIAANHTIIYDPLFIATASKKRLLHFVAKYEAFENPIARAILKSCNAFPIVRGRGDMQAINYASDLVKKGKVLCIFPEGTRSRDGYPKKAKSGVGLIARRAKCDIVPAAICVEQRGKFGTRVFVKFGEAIKYEEMNFTEDGGTKENKVVANMVMDRIVLLWRECRKKCKYK